MPHQTSQGGEIPLGIPTQKSHDISMRWFSEITWQFEYIISPFLEEPQTTN